LSLFFLTGRSFYLDRTRPVSAVNCSECNLTTGRCSSPDRTCRWRALQSGELGFATGCEVCLTGRHYGRVRSKYRNVPERVLSDRTRPVTPDRTRLRVRSLSALDFQIDRCHRPDASGHIDRRVRSVRNMLSWHLTVGIDYGGV
jgi:hypothetical protein